jgi:hypothetical protein
MRTSSSWLIAFTVLALTASARAQVSIPVEPGATRVYMGEMRPKVATGETSVNLTLAFDYVFAGAARLTLPVAQRLRITATPVPGVRFAWSKDGRTVVGATTNVLVLDYVTPGDAGTYACFMIPAGTYPRSSQPLVLSVGPEARVANSSARGRVEAGGAVTAGFIVTGSREKKLVVRAVGPGLAAFGVATPLARPILRIFDARGQIYETRYTYIAPAVVAPATPEDIARAVAEAPNFEKDLAESLALTGAFPLPAGSADVTELRPFGPGAYTAQVTSADGTAGEVLIEIYEVP